MRGKKWAKSTNSPDWTDIETLMRSIGTFHSAHVSVTISPLGIGAGGGLSTEVTATFDVLPGSAIPSLMGVSGQWPCPEHAELGAHVFGALYQLDSMIAKEYKNEKLWE